MSSASDFRVDSAFVSAGDGDQRGLRRLHSPSELSRRGSNQHRLLVLLCLEVIWLRCEADWRSSGI